MSRRIVGIVLVRNEERFVGQAIRNVAGFCDEMILCDHGSSDGTPEILQSFASGSSRFYALRHPRESHELLKPYCGTATWVFGVDGDELYDPVGLERLRGRLDQGEFDDVWRMKGNVLHCVGLGDGRARGFAAPPSRSITKLYNFGAIRSWGGKTIERLHGGVIDFAEGYHDDAKRNLQDEVGWDAADLRCLHLCFLPRSGADGRGARRNIMETYGRGLRGWVGVLVGRLGFAAGSAWKRDHYRRGPEVTVDAAPFLSGSPNECHAR